MTIKAIIACFKFILPILILTSLFDIGYAQSNIIYLKNGVLLPDANAQAWIAKNAQNKISGTGQEVLLQFYKLPTTAQKDLLREQDIALLSYIPDNTYVALISGNIDEHTITTCGIRSIINMEAGWKKDDRLNTSNQRTNKGNIEVRVSFYAIATNEDILATIQQLGGKIISNDLDGLNIYTVSLPNDKLNILAAWPFTQFISPKTDDVPLDIEANAAAKANDALAPVTGAYRGLTGAGVTIGVGDNTSGIFHIDLKDRIINYNPQAYTNHGVHINGIVGGAGIIDPKGAGMAQGATLINHYYSAVWEQTQAMYESHNMTLTNNSYAATVGNCRVAGVYDVNSQALDMMALAYPEVLHVFAAGNDGKLNCSPYPQGFGTITGGYQPAKNNIVVTSTDKLYVNAIDGSRGPVRDGRLKPEITAVGVDVYSTTRSEDYLVAGGTSMACPGVTGALGVLTERYRQLHGSVNPRADVLKAIILNSTNDIGNPGPDYRFGFGFMNLNRALTILDSNRYATNIIRNDEEQTITVNIPTGLAQVKVMLCWYDAVGNPSSSKQLVNDLDLEVYDPANILHQPLVLNTNAANILDNATEQADRLNNVEQVTINNPQPGIYTIKVKGYTVPSDTQQYVLSYDFVPVGVKITNPDSASQVKAGEKTYVYWDASDSSNSFSLEYTSDGTNWNVIESSIAGGKRYYEWNVPANINSGNCRMRLTRNGTSEVSVSGQFTINKQPVVTLSTSQCPGYINVVWDSIPNATAYELLKKQGGNMLPIDTVAVNHYSFSGLSLDSFYYVAVRPLFNNMAGYRSLAVKRQPKDGDCKDHASDGDLMVQAILNPTAGRKHTSSELSSNDTLSILLRNLDDVPQNYYLLSYKINNDGWKSQIYNTPLPANKTWRIDIAEIDFSAVGKYVVTVAIHNYLQADPVRNNDTITRTFQHLPNEPIDLRTAFRDGFEEMDIISIIKDSVGVSPNDHWDYINNSDTGRFRSRANTGLTITGNRSISLDAYKYTGTGSQNEFIGTFNLTNYDPGKEEVRMDFNYILHGQIALPEGNGLWVRGTDTAEWQKVFDYNTDVTTLGKVQSSGSLSLSDALLNKKQRFGTSTQVMFGQNDVSVIGGRDFGKGVTLDNVRIYTVQNDVQLLRVNTPEGISCGLPANTPLVVQVRNGVNQLQNNVQIFYQLNDGEIVAETIPTLEGKQMINYTFKKLLEIPDYRSYKLNVWISADGDSYRENDSILDYTFRNQPKVVSYPYYENFEANEGGWYAEGKKTSWEYGTPRSEKINKAASGAKAWKTNLDGNYNDNEAGYLNGPCFDLTGLTNPVLRFKLAYDIEYCGIVYCDAAYMEYSIDGVTWERLGKWDEGINWYSDTAYNVWSEENNTAWHEASIPLPKLKQVMRLRYVFTSDPGSNFEGIAVDDIEVLDQKYTVPSPGIVSVSPNPNRDGNVKIAWGAYVGTQMNIVITDMMGRVVYSTSVQAADSYNETTIHTPVFQSGVYFIRMQIGEQVFLRKIVYQKY